MVQNNLLIRPATLDDAQAILGIYAPYIHDTPITFETEVPTLCAFQERMGLIVQTHPFLVCCERDTIIGYAYAGQHMQRAAYQWNVTVSVYLDHSCLGKKAGSRLYAALLNILVAQGFINAYALVTVPNERSFRLHEKCGFALSGMLHKTGFKLGQWHDVAVFEKQLTAKTPTPMPIKTPEQIDLHGLLATA